MILFCAQPFLPGTVDPVYGSEFAAAKEVGFKTALLDYEALVDDGNAEKAVNRIPVSENEQTVVYRGWMLKPERFSALYDVLLAKRLRLINSPDEYRHCHWLPESYALFETLTPRTVWVRKDEGFDIDTLMERLAVFGDRPLVLKDFVKSRKHEWLEACFIPSALDRSTVERIVGRFLELQGDDLNEGLVFREYVEFEPLTAHSKSGMPLTNEWRMFFLDGRILDVSPYWEEGEYLGNAPSTEAFLPMVHMVRSRFFTLDLAKRKNGEWMVVELGDGQVAGLPAQTDVSNFYKILKSGLAVNGTTERRGEFSGGFWLDDDPAPRGDKSLSDYSMQLKAKRKRKR